MLTTICRFSHPFEAQVARARLEAAGIPVFVSDEHTINMQWLYSNALGGVRLQVPLACREEALALLAADNSEALLAADDDNEALLAADDSEALGAEQENSPRCCPRCGSEQVRWAAEGWRAFLSIWMLNTSLWPTRRRLICEACGEITSVDEDSDAP